MGSGNKNRTDVNKRVLEEEAERAVLVQPLCSPLQTVAVLATEKGRGTVGPAVADFSPHSHSLLPSSVMDPEQVTYPLIVQA